jgi:DNA polymerase-3 subunit gamma/tau
MVLALYRRYRPDTLQTVIGQEHVTEPLARAIDSDKVHHAYLFVLVVVEKQVLLELWLDR